MDGSFFFRRKDVYGHPALSPPVAAATGSGSKRALPPRAPRARARLRASRAPTGRPQSRWWKEPAESAHCQQELEQKLEQQHEDEGGLEGAAVVQEAAKPPHNTPEPAAQARAAPSPLIDLLRRLRAPVLLMLQVLLLRTRERWGLIGRCCRCTNTPTAPPERRDQPRHAPARLCPERGRSPHGRSCGGQSTHHPHPPAHIHPTPWRSPHERP